MAVLGGGWVLAFVVGFGENPGMESNSGDETLFEVVESGEASAGRVSVGRSKVFRRYDPDQSLLERMS